MTIDLKDKYIYSLQCIAEMQEEIMSHKKRIAEYETSAKRLCTLDEMIQVDIQSELSEQTLNMEIEQSVDNGTSAESLGEKILEDIPMIPVEIEEVDIDEVDIEEAEDEKEETVQKAQVESEVPMESEMQIEEEITMESVPDIEIHIQNSYNQLEKITNDFTKSIIQESLNELSFL